MRYFYTDPLAAAWMKHNYGMNFISARELFKDERSVCSEGLGWYGFYEIPSYIHPDSVHLLEPQVGDFLLLDVHLVDTRLVDLVTGGLVQRNATGLFMSHPEFRWLNDERHPIIQRNGLAFMRPETEE